MSAHRSRWAFALPALLLVAASACSSAGATNAYPTSVRAAFMSDCTARGAAPSHCSCALDGLQQTFTVEQFTALEALSPSAQGFPGLDALLASCSE